MINSMDKLHAFVRRIINKVIIGLAFLGIILFFLYLPAILFFFTDEKSINVYTFTEFVSPDVVRDFEKESGIKVNLQYYESNEELHAKFKINEGVGYDVIAPTDYMVETLRSEGLLQKIDYNKMPNAQYLDQRLLHKVFDPLNQYSVPIAWNVYGIIYDKTILTQKTKLPLSLDFLFKDPNFLVDAGFVKRPYNICMVDDPREVFMYAALFLLGRVTNLSNKDFSNLHAILTTQKKWVECYTNFGLLYFLEGNIASFAITSNRYVRNILQSDPRFGFCIPKEGSLIAIENFAIPIHSKKTEWAYAFINFVLSKELQLNHFNLYGSNPVNKLVYSEIDKKFFDEYQFFPEGDVFSKLLHLTRNDFPLKKIEDMWLAVKFS